MPSFLPSRDSLLLLWSANFSAGITADAVALGLTAAQATAYATLNDNFAAAMAAIDPGARSKSLVLAKNAARSALKTSARLLAKIIQGQATVTDAQKADLGLNVRSAPTPIPPPADAPGLSILSTIGNTVKLRLFDAIDSANRGRPAGTDGASVFSYVGAAAPTEESDWNFEGVTSRTKINITFPAGTAPGAKVWFTAFWFNERKQSGPAAAAIGINIPGGAAMAA